MLLQLRRLEQELGRHQHLHHAVVQVARHAGAFFLLRMHHALGQAPQLGAGDAVVLQVQQHTHGRNQHHAQRGDAIDALLRGGDVVLGMLVDALQRRLHVVQIQAGAHHPVPARHLEHIAQFGRGDLRRGLAPVIAHQPATGLRLVEDEPRRYLPVRCVGVAQIDVGHRHLLGVHQQGAVVVVKEEIAVAAELHARHHIHGFLLQFGLARVCRVRDPFDGAARQFHVMPQFGFLALQIGGLHHFSFFLGERHRLMAHGDSHAGQRHAHGDGREQ
ncbi:hypothetical protein SDC9_159902 [bioreactor metagenome]|uniref:Uncharacterized protein n=1 Tax=bioreactor metagenome TaxID=1076179 RepID=A0A645FJH2_9ZZZZ